METFGRLINPIRIRAQAGMPRPSEYMSLEGDRSMAITRRLRQGMPAECIWVPGGSGVAGSCARRRCRSRGATELSHWWSIISDS